MKSIQGFSAEECQMYATFAIHNAINAVDSSCNRAIVEYRIAIRVCQSTHFWNPLQQETWHSSCAHEVLCRSCLFSIAVRRNDVGSQAVRQPGSQAVRHSPRQCRNAFKAKLKFRRGNKLKLSSVCRLYNTRPSSDRAIFVKLPQGAIRYFENSTPIAIATVRRGRHTHNTRETRHTGEAIFAIFAIFAIIATIGREKTEEKVSNEGSDPTEPTNRSPLDRYSGSNTLVGPHR